jgi:hypothetical protein
MISTFILKNQTDQNLKIQFMFQDKKEKLTYSLKRPAGSQTPKNGMDS